MSDVNKPRTHSNEGHFFRGTSRRPVRISTSQENINFSITKTGSKRLVVIYPPVGGGRGGWTIQMATMVIIDATNRVICLAKGCYAKPSFIDQ